MISEGEPDDASTPTLLVELVDVSARVAATTKRTEKRAAIAALLQRTTGDEIDIAVAALSGEVRQGRIGIGWATLGQLDVTPAMDASLSIVEFDEALTELAGITGEGSSALRLSMLSSVFERATGEEQAFLVALLGGELRHGALEGVMIDAIAAAAEVPAAVVRRTHMLRGDLTEAARLALTGGRDALESVGLEVLRPIQPMLASTAADVGEAIGDPGGSDDRWAVEWKIDGVRIQVHRDGGDVLIVTRNLNDVTERLAGVVELALQLPAERFVLDGEVTGGRADSTADDEADVPAFQDTASRFASDDGGVLRSWFFDIVHLDGVDLLDAPWSERRSALETLVGDLAVPVVVTNDVDEAQSFLDSTIDAGHEGVMIKHVDTPYEAGRRGKSWRKVKPVITLDLIVLAAEWGHGRRTGKLSNLHLGARDPDGGPPIMVGKTFKGLTDALLEWQTARFAELAVEPDVFHEQHVVRVRPEQVIEIAIDGVQTSTRYPGGAALRFARVRGYRDDKRPDEADTIGTVRALRR